MTSVDDIEKLRNAIKQEIENNLIYENEASIQIKIEEETLSPNRQLDTNNTLENLRMEIKQELFLQTQLNNATVTEDSGINECDMEDREEDNSILSNINPQIGIKEEMASEEALLPHDYNNYDSVSMHSVNSLGARSIDSYEALGNVEACLQDDLNIKYENDGPEKMVYKSSPVKTGLKLTLTKRSSTGIVTRSLPRSESMPKDIVVKLPTRSIDNGEILSDTTSSQPLEHNSITGIVATIGDDNNMCDPDTFQLNSITGNVLSLEQEAYSLLKAKRKKLNNVNGYFVCTECPKTYTSKRGLKAHINVHRSIERRALGIAKGLQTKKDKLKKKIEVETENLSKKVRIETENAKKKTDIRTENAKKRTRSETKKAKKRTRSETQKAKKKAGIETENTKKKAGTETENTKKKAGTETENTKKRAGTETENTKKRARTETENTKKRAGTETESAKKRTSRRIENVKNKIGIEIKSAKKRTSRRIRNVKNKIDIEIENAKNTGIETENVTKNLGIENENVTESPQIEPKKEGYECTCGKVFGRRSKMETCLRSHDFTEEQFSSVTFSCVTCLKSFKNKDELALHRKRLHRKRFPCKFCPTYYDTRKHLIKHLQIHQQVQLMEYKVISEFMKGNQKLKCFMCSKTCVDLSELKTHVLNDHKDPYECPHCKNTFSKIIDFANHIKAYHPEVEGQCVLDVLEAFSKLVQAWKCQECGLQFLEADKLALHQIEEHTPELKAEPQFQCADCRRVFVSQKGLTSHRRIHHSTETPEESKEAVDGIMCLECRKICKDMNALTSHMRFHSPDRKYPCKFCDFRFATYEKRKAHSEIHTGDMKYVCFICEYQCSSEDRLKRHKMSLKHANIKEYLLTGKPLIEEPPKTPQEDTSSKKDAKTKEGSSKKRKKDTEVCEKKEDSESSSSDSEVACDICGEQFSSESEMLEHKQTHPFIEFPNEDTPTRIFFK